MLVLFVTTVLLLTVLSSVASFCVEIFDFEAFMINLLSLVIGTLVFSSSDSFTWLDLQDLLEFLYIDDCVAYFREVERVQFDFLVL